MSQSPVNAGNLGSLESYRQGWKALNRLLHESKSFSGRETNNAFLNCADRGQFADVSTAIGWDFADDARAIGLVDWDRDGDLDIWVTNRTAPRVRLLKNNLDSDASFVSFQLTGTIKTTNRDGIGSRVNVYLKGHPVPLMRTLHAGQSFLSQSSRWMHFGLGEQAAIEKVVVNWHGGEAEEFKGVSENQFFNLVQGSGQATLRGTLPAINLPPAEAGLPPRSDIARIIPTAGHALPTLRTADRGNLKIEGLTLISLWSRTCPHCQKEMTAWAAEKEAWKNSGVKVIALSTDQELRQECDAFLKSVGADFLAEMASPDAVELLDALQSSLVDLWLAIPVPSSFLVSAEGELLAVYRGPVSREQVVKDSALARATPEERRASATPFTGRWVGPAPMGTPQGATEQLMQRARPELAIQYLRTALSRPFVKASKSGLSDNLLLLGQLLGQQGRPAEAVPPLREAARLMPDDIRVLRLLVAGLSESGEVDEATEVMNGALSKYPDNPDLVQDALRLALATNRQSRALELSQRLVDLLPADPSVRFTLIRILLLNGEGQAAIDHCKAILGTHPRYLAAANQLSRILSTHPSEELRSPEEALALATRLCQITQNRDAGHLVALALAQANKGQFRDSRQLLESLQKSVPAETELGREISAALASVSNNQPVRNKVWPVKPNHE